MLFVTLPLILSTDILKSVKEPKSMIAKSDSTNCPLPISKSTLGKFRSSIEIAVGYR